MSIDLSSGTLYQPLQQGTAQVADLTGLMWPTYRRTTLAKGGDHTADFYVDTLTHAVTRADLEQWFLTWVGSHFVETYAGQTTFEGYVNALRLYSGGSVWSISLDRMSNSVRTLYTAGSASSPAIGTEYQDTGSQAIYGTKETILTPLGYMTSGWANAVSSHYLSNHAYPVPYVDEVALDYDDSAALEVSVLGYTHTLGWVYVNDASTTSTAVSTIVSDTLALATEFVSAGTLESIGTTSTEEVEYTPILERFNTLFQDSAYEWGCTAGRSFDLTGRDLTTIKYRRRAFDLRRGLQQYGAFVPDPLVTPGGVVWTEDVFAGLPQSSTLIDDPRASYIGSVEYSIDGTVLRDDEASDRDDAAQYALAMAKGLTVGGQVAGEDYRRTSDDNDTYLIQPIGRLR